MKIFLGNHLSLLVVLFLIISSEHLAVKGGIYNKQSPVTIQHDLYKFIETTRGTSKLQSPANLQQEFHRFIRKTGGASELENSYSTLSSRPQSSFVPPTKPKGEFNEKSSTYKRVKRSFYQEQINLKPSAPSYVRRNVDQDRYRSFTNSDVGRLERLPKNGQPKISSRPRGLMNFGLMQQGGFSKQTNRPQSFFKQQKHSQNSSKPQYMQNPFLNQPIDPQRNPKFQSIDHRFKTHNEQHTKLHNSDTFPPRKTSTKPSSSVHNLSHQFSTFNTRPKNTPGHKNSHFTIHRPQTDQNVGFSRPSSQPVNFSSILNKPVTSAVNVPDTNDDRTEDMPNRPKKTKGHTNSHFTIHKPQTDQNLAFSRPSNRPVDFSSILNKPVSSAVKVPGTNDDGTENKPNRKLTKPEESSGSGKPGCSTPSGLRRPGEVWYSNGCRRSKCIAFRGQSFIETDQCDTEIYNTTYKCIIDVDIKAKFPGCCPKYRCNPDNLGNLVDKSI